jgi:hypothetical protein
MSSAGVSVRTGDAGFRVALARFVGMVNRRWGIDRIRPTICSGKLFLVFDNLLYRIRGNALVQEAGDQIKAIAPRTSSRRLRQLTRSAVRERYIERTVEHRQSASPSQAEPLRL